MNRRLASAARAWLRSVALRQAILPGPQRFIVKTLQTPKPPLHLVLGREGFANVERRLKAQLAQ